MRNRIIIGLAAAAIVVGGVAGMSAFEAHIINVTAKIENALTVPMEHMDFGTVFPEEVFYQTFTVALSESFQEQAACSDVNLLNNGGFEEPDVTNSAKWQTFPSNEVPGWDVNWVNPAGAPDPALIEYQEGVNGWSSHEGDQWTELASDWGQAPGSETGDARVIISREVSTTVGAKYFLTYWYSGRPGRTSADNKMEVRVTGLSPVSHIEGNPGSNTAWKKGEIEFVASSDTTKIEFQGTGANYTHGMFLDDVVLVECGRVTSVDYVLRQKPKCVDDQDPDIHPQVMHDGEGNFECPEDSTMMPLLCPYLSKSEETTDGDEGENDGDPIEAFHGPLTDWDMDDTEDWQVLGRLSFSAEDLDDEWLIDLHAPCFEGYCAQDNVIPEEYQADIEDESEVFGCDLWLEVTGINGIN